jgi:hypothetical protein
LFRLQLGNREIEGKGEKLRERRERSRRGKIIEERKEN